MFTAPESAAKPESLFSLETERIVLKPLALEHIGAIYRLVSSSGDLHEFTHVPENYSEEDARSWVTENAGRPYFFVLTDRVSGVEMGVLSVVEYVHSHRRAEVGFWMGKEFRGQGFMAEALRMMVVDLFTRTEVRKIIGRVISENTASAGTLLKAGFSEEALLPQYEYHRGEMKDVRIFAINRS